MINTIILVFVGGAMGALIREFLMIGVPPVADGFPLDILVANIAATFLLGLTAAFHARKIVTDSVNTLVGTGIMGGLSTFSSFVYGAVVLIGASVQSALVAILYLLVSVALGYVAITLGLRMGGAGSARP
ncbi:CrcB family protein [Kaistia dalseonensis]|uniref:Fluoride-specific ion channel FluC n=1 Tax=Kaistia dalseonensis TaxID=410840 RepID=A0ABU0H8Q2_9HYPH|nr:CrcB family protein [Kaistia dalseonensis]MCX5496080.1 CrcB family protein [Kaistia dalseonensis]MDQ0438684.1 CrcB protein [Kaistia dalseonensis]